jgi:hypothetical protein
MAARATSAFYHFTLILHLFLLINYNCAERYGDRARTLHITEKRAVNQQKNPLVIDKNTENSDDFEPSFVRERRDVPAAISNITTKV